MAMTAVQVEEAMLALDRRELATLVHRAIQALDPGEANASQDDIDRTWHNEIARRIDEIQTGEVELVSVDESFARIRAKRARR